MPWLPAGGVPARVAVPLPPVKVTPDGRAGLLVAVRAGVGLPAAVTANVLATPTPKVVEAALVMAGATVAGLTVRVKVWAALGLTPLAAVRVTV